MPRNMSTLADETNQLLASHIRDATAEDVGRLAQLWFDGWQDAHASILPAEVTKHRTLESFQERLADNLVHTRMIGTPDRALGFYMIKNDELYQFYVAKEARGMGIAGRLLEDSERRLLAQGASKAWLACAIGNARAERFYSNHGWVQVGPMINELDLPSGVFRLTVWRYEKLLLKKT